MERYRDSMSERMESLYRARRDERRAKERAKCNPEAIAKTAAEVRKQFRR